MNRVCFVDPIGGAAGDMLLAALIDAGADPKAVRDAIESVLPGRFRIGVQTVERAGLRALQMVITDGAGWGPPDVHRTLEASIATVERSPLQPAVRQACVAAMQRLAQAERRAHGDTDAGPSGELGDDDTILDVVGVITALRSLDVQDVEVGALPLAFGDRVIDHGSFSVPTPGPATLELLEGFAIKGEGSDETVTPTAAALLASLGRSRLAPSDMVLERVGYGAGQRDTPHYPNVVRVLVGTAGEVRLPASTRSLILYETNVDDLTPELIADAVQALNEAGALDVWTTPIQMKKSRPGVMLSALCEAPGEAAILEAFFEATPTFGVRHQQVSRTELSREVVQVPVAGGDVGVKLGYLDGRLVNATPEHDDVAEVARRTGRAVRHVYEEAASAARAIQLGGEQNPARDGGRSSVG